MRLLWFPTGLLFAALHATSVATPIKVWVELRDKGPTEARDRALEDAPLYGPYLQRLSREGFKSDVTLKWQNLVSGWVDSANITDLENLPMVRRVEIMPRKTSSPIMSRLKSGNAFMKTAATLNFGVFQQLFDTTQASALRAVVSATGQGAGQGLRIAVIDADFSLGGGTFSHLWQNDQIMDQWDFTHNRPVAAYDTLGDSHGAAVLSILAGKSGSMEGLVPEAKYLLYIAQNVDTEFYNEEDWVAGAIERAVDSGAQVINISLADRFDYNYNLPAGSSSPYDVPYASMNGRTRPSSLAALGAARRGVLVSVAMGNDGTVRDDSPTISAPADADSILSVGILDLNLQPCGYTSTGPTADGRIKPEVSSIGPNSCTTPTADPTLATGVEYQGGTSFAAPLVAGVAALLRQLHPALSAQTIRLALITTAGQFSKPDNAAGYGLVRAGDAHQFLSSGQGAFVWEGHAPRVYMPGRQGTVHLWDMEGRAIPAQGGGSFPVFWIDSGPDRASGVYVWRISQ